MNKTRLFLSALSLLSLTSCINLSSLFSDKHNTGINSQTAENTTTYKNSSSKTESDKYVDLGLPSGTLWATKNVGANRPEQYGAYFAWGETEDKSFYDNSTYKWNYVRYYNPDGHPFYDFTKYCTKKQDGIVDNKTKLDYYDDAAYVNWGAEWCIPTVKQFKELITECTWTWTQKNGVNGYIVSSKHNDNSLFLPAGGEYYEDHLINKEKTGKYWSCSGSGIWASILTFESWNVDTYHDWRPTGLNIRPVYVPR